MYNAKFSPEPAKNPAKPTFASQHPIILASTSATGQVLRFTVMEAMELQLALSKAITDAIVAGHR